MLKKKFWEDPEHLKRLAKNKARRKREQRLKKELDKLKWKELNKK